MAIVKLSAETAINSSATAAVVKTPDVIKIAPATVTTVSGRGQIGAAVEINNLYITDSDYTVLDDQAISTAGGYIKLIGQGFKSGCIVYAAGTAAITTTFVSATEVRAQLGAASSDTLQLILTNPDGSAAIFLSGIVYSGTPAWVTEQTLPAQIVDESFSINLTASSDSNVVYSLAAGSSLPPGTTLSNVGVFAGTITGLSSETVYSFNVVAVDEELQDTARTFSISVSVGDAYFTQTVLALPSDTAGSWLTDSSSNNYLITAVGDARPSSFTPYQTGWSNYFDGTGDRLTVPASADFAFVGDFTIEAWMSFDTISGSPKSLIGMKNVNVWFDIRYYNGNWQISFNSGGGTNVAATPDPVPGQWYHVAVVRSGSTVLIYVDGVLAGSTTNANTLGYSNVVLGIGADAVGGNQLQGYISNLRIVNGTAVYTENFTPPTEPLTAIPNTVLLTCQSNRFVDNSTNNYTVTKVGDTKVFSNSPFVNNLSTNGSGYFDGAGDYLRVSSSGITLSGDFTIECWIYPTAFKTYSEFITSGSANFELLLNNSTLSFFTLGLTHNVAVNLNSWSHVALTRSGTTVRLFLNGVESTSSASSSNSFTVLNIGSYTGGAETFVGFISDVRVNNAEALYVSNFTPTSQPLTTTINTALLTLQKSIGENNSRFVDSSGLGHVLTRTGNALQGSDSPYGNKWSVYFNGDADYLTVPSDAALQLGTEDWTIEGWFFARNPTSVNIYDPRPAGVQGAYPMIWINAQSRLSLWVSNADRISSTAAIQRNRWYHFAFVRSNGVTKLYLDGTQSGSNYTDTNNYTSTSVRIGYNINNVYSFLGHISNLRVVKGSAVYVSDFTPPATPLAAIANTSLLICQSNNFVDNSGNNFAITPTSDVRADKFGPFRPTTSYDPLIVGGSGNFDGNDFISIPASSPAFNFSTTTNMTFECWFNLTNTTGTQNFFDIAECVPFRFGYSNGSFFWQATSVGTTVLTSARTLYPYVWYHFACTRDGNTVRMFLNGTLIASGSYTSAWVVQGATAYIGCNRGNTWFVLGNISDLRLVKGTALYTDTFTPPTQALTAIPGTSLLANFTSAGIANYIGINDIETVGTVRTVSDVKQYGTGSIKFDGSGYLSIPSDWTTNFGLASWTIEFWIYWTGETSNQIIFTQGANLTGAYGPLMVYKSGASLLLFASTNGSSWNIASGSSLATLTANQWTHCALTRNGATSMNFWKNGVLAGGGGNSSALWAGSTAPFTFGAGLAGASGFIGYMADIRITNGISRYNSAFTPPAAPLLTR